MTKEEKHREANRRYYQKNKQKVLAYNKKWRTDNKEYQSNYYDNMKDDYHRVYLLEDYNYVGVTNNVYRRFAKHKYHNNRDCTNHRILYKTKDRSEALELEALLHDIGYEGKHNRWK